MAIIASFFKITPKNEGFSELCGSRTQEAKIPATGQAEELFLTLHINYFDSNVQTKSAPKKNVQGYFIS